MLLFLLSILSIPIFITFCLIWLYHLTKNITFKFSAFGIWILIGLFFITGFFFNLLISKTEIDKEDFYGSYIR